MTAIGRKYRSVCRGNRTRSIPNSKRPKSAAGNSLQAQKAPKHAGRREQPSRPDPVTPDPHQGIDREEGGEGGKGVVVQRRVEGKQERSPGGAEQAEKPGPIVRGITVKQPRIQDQEGPQRHDVQQHDQGFEIEDIRRPLDRIFGRLEHERVHPFLLDVARARLLEEFSIERDARGGSNRGEEPGDERRQQRRLARIEMLDRLPFLPRLRRDRVLELAERAICRTRWRELVGLSRPCPAS